MATTKILVVAPPTPDECVAVHALLQVLRAHKPEAQIDMLAQDSCVPLLMQMPEVERAITLPMSPQVWALQSRYQFALRLKQEAYDQAIVLPLSFKAALIPFMAEIPVRTGWRGQMRFILLNDIRLLVHRRYPQRYQQFAALGFADAENPPPAEQLPHPQCVPQPAPERHSG